MQRIVFSKNTPLYWIDVQMRRRGAESFVHDRYPDPAKCQIIIRATIMNRFAAGDLESDLEEIGPIKFRIFWFESRLGKSIGLVKFI